MDEAVYVPISADRIPDAMAAWERYANTTQQDLLIQLAILHAEFEALHPFLDGNGRMGRMLVPLYLWQVELIRQPAFYISAYFEARREVYYDRLLAVSRDNDWTGWCRFFLEAVRSQAEANILKAMTIHELHGTMKHRIFEATRSPYGVRALDWIFERPTFTSTDFVTHSGIPASSARRLLDALRREGVLTTISEASGRRAVVLTFKELVEIAQR